MHEWAIDPCVKYRTFPVLPQPARPSVVKTMGLMVQILLRANIDILTAVLLMKQLHDYWITTYLLYTWINVSNVQYCYTSTL